MPDDDTTPTPSRRAVPDDRILAEAVAWEAALATDDADWDGYVEWLETDDRHRQAFDAVALVDRTVDHHRDRLASLVPATADDAHDAIPTDRRSSRRWILGGGVAALAAAAAAVLLVGNPLGVGPTPDAVYRSGTGIRHLALGGGVNVDLAPASTLVAREGDPTRLALVEGEAFLDVVHDPGRSLSVDAAGAAITDIGTSFGLNVSSGFLLVSVSDGRVGVAPPGSRERLTVSAGQRYTLSRRTGAGSVAGIARAGIGSWRRGQLTYDDTPLPVVAADIGRFSGTPIDLDPALAGRRFSGALSVGGGSRAARSLADIMAVHYEEDGGRIRLSASPAG